MNGVKLNQLIQGVALSSIPNLRNISTRKLGINHVNMYNYIYIMKITLTIIILMIIIKMIVNIYIYICVFDFMKLRFTKK